MRVIVVGATGTIDSAVAQALAASGHEVVGVSRRSAVKVDITDATSVKKMFEGVRDVDAVVCCAGDASFKPLLELSRADYDTGLHSKMMGQVTLARAACDHLRDGGSITLTTGVLATQPMPGSAAVSLANAGLEGFVRAAALEMPRKLRINAVSPPWIKETMVKLGMDPTPGIPAVACAKAYVLAVEGAHQGKIFAAATS